MNWIALLLICFFSLVLPSCHKKIVPQQSTIATDPCESYYNFIRNNFRADSLGIYDRKKLFPKEGKELTVRYRNEIVNQCLIGKTKEEIIAIFGKPSYSQDNRMDYYFSNNCSGQGKDQKSSSISNCVRFKIYFNRNGIITTIPAIGDEQGQKQ